MNVAKVCGAAIKVTRKILAGAVAVKSPAIVAWWHGRGAEFSSLAQNPTPRPSSRIPYSCYKAKALLSTSAADPQILNARQPTCLGKCTRGATQAAAGAARSRGTRSPNIPLRRVANFRPRVTAGTGSCVDSSAPLFHATTLAACAAFVRAIGSLPGLLPSRPVWVVRR